MKKIVLCLVCFTFILSGCTNKPKKQNTKPVVTVTTSFLQDMVEILAGDLVELNTIIPAGEDPHLYVAKPNDVNKLKEADLILFHGLHFEGKLVDVLEKIGIDVTRNFDPTQLKQLEVEHHQIVDPHFWFNIDLYKQAFQTASQALINLLPEHTSRIETNQEHYLLQLEQLKQETLTQIQTIPEAHRYLITPHDAFNYFSDFYNVTVLSPQGVSTDSEVSNQDLEKTAQFIVDHQIKAIFAESTTDPARMKKLQEIVASKGFSITVVEGEDHELFSDSLAPKGHPGDHYLDMIKHNINLIVQYLK